MKLLILCLLAIPLSAHSQTPVVRQDAQGPCSATVLGNNNQVFTCRGIDKKTADQMLSILNRIMADQIDPALVMRKLDDVLKTLSDIKSATASLQPSGSDIEQQNGGPGSPNTSVTGNGNVITNTINLGSADGTVEQRKQVRIALGNFMTQAVNLRDRCKTDDPSTSLETEAQDWFAAVQVWLKQNLDSSFYSQFVFDRPSAFSPGGVRPERVNLWLGLNERIEVLDKFIDEFK